MKINIFKPDSPVFPYRWLLVLTMLTTGCLVYANLTGVRLLSFPNQQQWNASGSGYHK